MRKIDALKVLLKISLFIILILIPIFIFNISSLSKGNSFEITFNNTSDVTLHYFELYEKNISSNIIKTIPTIPANDKLTLKVDLSENFTKGSIILSYKDNKNVKRKILLINNIESGSYHKIDIKINGVNENGILLLDKEYQNII